MTPWVPKSGEHEDQIAPIAEVAKKLSTVSIILGGFACKYALASTAFLNVFAGSLDRQAQPQAK